VNNVNDKAFIYQNKANEAKDNQYISIQLNGSEKNRNAIGSKVILFTNNQIRTYEKFPVKGFLSSMEVPMLIGLKQTKLDSAFLVWPDNSFEKIDLTKQFNKQKSYTYKKGLPIFNYDIIKKYWPTAEYSMQDLTASSGINFKHQENVFQEFNREQLVPQMNSTEGPALAIADINHDQLEDIFVGGARGFAGAVFSQQPNGKFIKIPQPALALDSNYEDVAAVWADFNKDGHIDLAVASGGNEYYGKDVNMLSRIYLNDGKGNLRKLDNAIPIHNQSSAIIARDFNMDGAIDLFITSRVMAMNYGAPASSYVLFNTGDGHFKEVTEKVAPSLNEIGFITNAIEADMDGDGNKELVLTHQWGGIDLYNTKTQPWIKSTITNLPGWWNFAYPIDIDKDGDMDLVAGNLGLNTRLKATEEEPITLYYNDFDDNGKKEQVMSFYLQHKEIPFANKDEIQRQIPKIKKNFLYAEDFAKASLVDIFTKDKLNDALQYKAYYFANTVFINEGNGKFSPIQLPWEAQITAYKTAAVCDINGDALPDLLMMGNYFDNNVQMGRYDADYGTVLINQGKGHFKVKPFNGLSIKGQVRNMQPIKIAQQANQHFVLAMNSDSLRLIQINTPGNK
jgi:hypothetical protein